MFAEKKRRVKMEQQWQHSFIDETGERWWRIVGLAKDLGVTDECIRDWIEQGLVERKDVEGEKRPRVRLREGVVRKEGARRSVLMVEGE
jgi:hypothetical protein